MDFLKVKLVNSSTNHVLQFQVDLMVNLLTTEPLDCNDKLDLEYKVQFPHTPKIKVLDLRLWHILKCSITQYTSIQ